MQLYDADTNAKLGSEIRVRSSTGDGTVAGGAFSFEVPFTKPQRLTAEVIADAGATRSQPSTRSELVVVGELCMANEATCTYAQFCNAPRSADRSIQRRLCVR